MQGRRGRWWSSLNFIVTKPPSRPQPGIFTGFQHIHTQIYTHITLHAHVHIFGPKPTCVRANIYYGRCICVRAIYYRHMYTCEYIFLMLLRLTVHICIRAKIYIMAYHLLLDFTKPYSGKPPHRASIGQS